METVESSSADRRPMSEFEQSLARSIAGVGNQSEVYQSAVEVASETVDPDVAIVVTRHMGDLVQVASRSPPHHEVAPTLPADSVPGTSMSMGQPVLVDDQDVFQSDIPDAVETPLSPYRSLIAHPFGEEEVLVVGEEAPHAFDETDAEHIETIAAFVEGVLEAIEGDERPAAQQDHLEQVAAVLSHDVENILTVVNGYLALLAEETRSRDEVASIQRGLDRLDQLIEDLVTILRTEEEDLTIEPVDLRDVVGECWQLVESGETKLVYGDLATVMADESRLRQILENLLRNAVEHTDEDGTVWVGAMDEGRGLYVEDDGPGIPPERRERVFDYGYSGSGDSTGLGLSIVQWMAEAHGWEVEVADAELGGARFELTGLELDRE